ncbi:MAG: hypothetical protein P8M18_06865 [Woeseiaceae bacterium]|nr:hypothetical protein [Woeseiaceae bacterium]
MYIYHHFGALRVSTSALLLGALAASVLATAQELPRFTHANFVEGERSITSLVEFPDVDGNIEIIVTCTGIASAKGRLQEAKCSAPNDPDLDFTMAVSRRFNATRLIPATVDGNPEEVDFQFVVHFRKEGDEETVNVYPNNSKNVDRLGLDYVSAQRFSPYVWPNRCGTWRREELILEVAIIDATGKPKDVDLVTAESSLRLNCKAALINQLENGRWVPAVHKGQFVDSIWVNPIILNRMAYKRQQ